MIDLTQDLKGYNVTCDNFFTPYNLGHIFLKKQLTMIGKIRKNKPTIPLQLLAKEDPDSRVHIDICIHKGYNSCIVHLEESK